MKAKPAETWDIIVECCKSEQSSINVGSKERRDAILWVQREVASLKARVDLAKELIEILRGRNVQ